jgi:spoIIIJ-associated protein
MRSVEAEGGTIDEAIANALRMLRVAREQVEIDILANASRGVLGFGGKPARVRATLRESSSPVVSQEALAGHAQDILAEILRRMGTDCTVEPRPDAEPGTVVLAVRGNDSGLVIGRHGQTLDALEYLLNRIAARNEEGAPRVVIDVERYRERRREALEQMALRLAAKARQTGRVVALDPMSPRDRRIVHLALQGDPAVTTRSQGEGHFRRLLIIPQGRLRRDDTPEPRHR